MSQFPYTLQLSIEIPLPLYPRLGYNRFCGTGLRATVDTHAMPIYIQVSL